MKPIVAGIVSLMMSLSSVFLFAQMGGGAGGFPGGGGGDFQGGMPGGGGFPGGGAPPPGAVVAPGVQTPQSGAARPAGAAGAAGTAGAAASQAGAGPSGRTPRGGNRPSGAGSGAGVEPEADADVRPTGKTSETVGMVRMTQIPLTTKVGGRLTPANTVVHQVTANGIVKAVFVRVGQAVKTGDRLFSVERDDLAGSYVPATVVARIDGTVSSIPIRTGATVKTGEQGVVLIDTGSYLLDALVSDKDALSLGEGTQVSATVVGGAILKGSIRSRSPEPDYTTGLYTVSFAFPFSREVAPGQFATVELTVGRIRGIFLKQELLRRMYGRYQVWVVDADNKLEDRRVTIGAIYGNQVLILDGLKPGERVLLKLTGKENAGTAVEGLEP